MDAYLDIETTGLSPAFARPTVVGIAIDFPGDWFIEQLVGDDITVDAILHILEGVTTVYTFNGARFRLAFSGPTAPALIYAAESNTTT